MKRRNKVWRCRQVTGLRIFDCVPTVRECLHELEIYSLLYFQQTLLISIAGTYVTLHLNLPGIATDLSFFKGTPFSHLISHRPLVAFEYASSMGTVCARWILLSIKVPQITHEIHYAPKIYSRRSN